MFSEHCLFCQQELNVVSFTTRVSTYCLGPGHNFYFSYDTNYIDAYKLNVVRLSWKDCRVNIVVASQTSEVVLNKEKIQLDHIVDLDWKDLTGSFQRLIKLHSFS